MRRVHFLQLGAVIALTALALAGCGKKGPLEPPLTSAQAPAQNSAPSQVAQTRTLANTDEPGLIQSPDIVYQQSAIAQLNSATKNPARPINAQPLDRPSTFILDPLVK